MAGTLYLVPTPIGNLGDITLRSIEVLRSCQRLIAEDTRRSRKLLGHLGIDARGLERFDAHAQDHDIQRVLGWLQGGDDVGLMTDAGTPSVSDPGADLTRMACGCGINVIALPGASAVTTAVAVSGLVDGAFSFFGFLPRTQTDRAKIISQIASLSHACVLFESPHRTQQTLEELASILGGREVVVARELTKLHEEIIRTTLPQAAASPREWLGEITIVIGAGTAQTTVTTDEQVDERIDEELERGVHTKVVAERVAAWSGRARRDVYLRVLERKGK